VTARSLAALIADAPGFRVRRRVGSVAVDDATTMVTGIAYDSRRVGAGELFCCVPGALADGHEFAGAAYEAGASALLVDHELDIGVTQLVVDDVRAAMAPLAAAFHHHPSRSMIVVGVTGTNGKTTTTALLASIFEANGWHSGLVGTLTGAKTTPEAPDLQAQLASFRDDGCQAVAVEVSSHALAQHRVDATHFALAVFTNLTQDHLDFHATMERYFAAKARLFEADLSERGVINVDDPHGSLLASAVSIPVTTFSIDDALELNVSATACSFRWHGHTVRVPLGGRFNAANALAAATAAHVLGIDDDVIVSGLERVAPVPGRFESVDAGQSFAVVVDYAHTPDGLAKVLSAARDGAGDGRVLVVFGCGGDRDAAKRPIMGRIAAAGADVVVITSDNPRREDPAAIISAVRSGILNDGSAIVVTEADRRTAIAIAIGHAAAGDVVVIAGKGHEPYQEVGDTRLPFDDRAVARQLLIEVAR